MHDKQARVDEVFHKVASRYDLMNDLMSGGLHRVWKDIFAARVRPSKTARFRHLDVAGGTGDIAFRVAEAGSASTEVVVLDINAGMLEEGRRRAAKRRFDATLDFVEANAEDLPFADNSFDCLYDCLRHSQRAAHRQGARRGAPGSAAWRQISLP